MTKKKPATSDDIARVPTDSLTAWDNNPRSHSDDQIARLVGSIQEFGWTRPILVDENLTILAGHGAWEAAKAMGEDKVPILIKPDLTEDQKRAYVIADNQLALQADWDVDALRLELHALPEDLLDFTGFKEFEITKHMRLGPVDDDDPEPEPEETDIEEGDLFQLGEHRLLCGDATKAEDVERLLGGAKPHLMVTDPPYGVNYDADWRNKAKRPDGTPYGASAIGKVNQDDKFDWRDAWSLFPGDVAYVWHAGTHANEAADSLIATKFKIRSQIIWVKSNIVISRGHYHVKHEPCWYAVRKKAHWQKSRNESTVWEIDKPQKSETGHSTQKPIECMRRPMLNNSKRGEAVYDPFLGSGTTVIAAEMEGRICYAMELNPLYCQMAVNRWERYTGEKTTKLK